MTIGAEQTGDQANDQANDRTSDRASGPAGGLAGGLAAADARSALPASALTTVPPSADESEPSAATPDPESTTDDEAQSNLAVRAQAWLKATFRVRRNGGRDDAQGPGRPGVAATPLQSLTPQYEREHHETYLRRLEEAVSDPANLNIALTGRYGAGKSSVLDQFEANHRATTQRLAISTLAPGEEGESTTNRIQKEIVKQLVYGATQKVGKNSRFTKIAVLSKPRAFAQSATLVACVGTLMYMCGWLPDIKWTGSEETVWVRCAAWVAAAALASLVVGSLRLVTYGRFLSDVSAAGAGLTLSEKPESFFDKYLDEIVHYFDRESKDIVIFEDLDRFDDPHIFEALRELNILLNATPRRRVATTTWSPRRVTRRRDRGVPLRFVYAVRDSVFESIGTATTGDATVAAGTLGSTGHPHSENTSDAKPADAAAAETLRANRTKFFDIVIPLVPFISHRNARDLLIELLAERRIADVDARLVNTIARHCTDMRLMRNMCNEYLVFAERLLEPDGPGTPAPGMDASRLFALVAYKNFHLKDFENITRRDSDLDRLYESHRRIVRESIAAHDERKRQLLAEPARVRTREETASMLVARLSTLAEPARRAAGYSPQHPLSFRVGTTMFEPRDATGYAFWAEVAQQQRLDILAAGTVVRTLDGDSLAMFAPEGLDADRWVEYDESAVQSELADLEIDVVDLRRADFADLMDMPRFTLAPDSPAESAARPPQTFAQLVTSTLRSDLARDLVGRGYIDRNFPLYAAQFYGHFIGVDVANFMVQHVQTSTMDVAYDLSKPGYVANLLAEADDAGEDLLDNVAAYNIDIINYLLVNDPPGAAAVVRRLIASGPDDEAATFLAAYFTATTAERTRLAALLADQGWREVFSYLVGDSDVPTDARPALVSAAIAAFDAQASYEFNDDVRRFISAHYGAMAAFGPLAAGDEPAERPGSTPELGDGRVPGRVAAVLDRSRVVLPDLAKVRDPRVRALVVEANRYALTADNLRMALDVRGAVPLDRVTDNETVYAYCLQHLPAYLGAVGPDSTTGHVVNSPEMLVKVLRDLSAGWDENRTANPQSGDVADLLAHTSPRARLMDLRAAPRSTWTALAAAGLFRASLANVEDYRLHAGGAVDAHLASLLHRAGVVHVGTAADVTDPDGNEYDRAAVAVAILNTEAGLTNEERVELAANLDAPLPLPAEAITWAAGDLFALLLERDLVADDAATFDRIRLGGWDALGPAIAASNGIANFIGPALMEGMVGDLLTDRTASAKVGRLIVDRIDEYVPEDDWPALQAAATYADTHAVPLEPAIVLRIARVQRASGVIDAKLMLRLLCATSPGPTADDIVEAFAHLGSPYAQITQSGTKFKVDRDDVHDQLLKVLKADDRITRGTTHATPFTRSQYTVTVS